MAAATAPAAHVAAMSPEPHDIKTTIEDMDHTKPTNALTPPTSEEMNHESKQEDDDSELSDLDMEDDGEEIVPDHYWDGGKIPVFKPTMEQFRSFKKYVEKIDKYGMKSGIVKVIPPKEWRDTLPPLDDYVKRIKIKNPITQEFNGTLGTYTQQNVEKQRSYNLPEWKSLTEETQYQPPAKRGERRRKQEKVVRGGGSARGRGAAATPAASEPEANTTEKPKAGRGRRGAAATAASKEPTTDKASTPDVDSRKPAKGKPGPKPRGRQPGKGSARSVTSRRLNNTAEAADYVDEAAFKDFDYRMDGLDEYTPERCAELETHYWKSLGFNQPMYAADMPGSLFDDTTKSWNVAKLENLLDVLGTKVPGVNTAYLYMGMWKATFAWHLEDVDLYSINYIHFGAPKQWYSISQEDARKFEAAMRANWPVDAKSCDQFLRHKTYLISPDVLQKQYGVKVNKLVHYEGEFVITYPYGYHSGYNIGYNCAESVNFATESWLEYGRIARKCNCEADNVWVDVNEIERKLRGEPTPEYIEETDDDDDDNSDEEDGNLPSPPASVKGKAQRGKKRKRDAKEEKPKKKKRIRIKIKTSTREPCAMCPNDPAWEPLLPTDNGRKAHRICALYTPETWVEKDEHGNERVHGVATIDRARLELKCNFCRSKRGACFQCSSKKCTRAFHASCALAAGVLIDGGLVPTFGEDGTEYYEEGFDFRCKYHRPKMPKKVDADALENSKRVFNYAKDLKPNDVVQAQYVGSEIFAGLVIENRPDELSVLVDVLPEGDRVEIEWKWLAVLNPDDSVRPKPTANAIPMPQGMNKKQVSVNNRQDGVPKQDELFHDDAAYKWSEFSNVHTPPPGYKTGKMQTACPLKVDINTPDQWFFYLPSVSTETKPAFTDRPGSKEAAPRANFLERVKPARVVTKAPSTVKATPVSRPAPPQAPGQLRHIQSAAVRTPSDQDNRPYAYKPREPSQPNLVWSVDPQSLATQRSFLAEAGRRASTVSDHSQSGQAALRPFSREHYYSTETLPAAVPGEYSNFIQHVRRESHGPGSLPRPGPELAGYAPANMPYAGVLPHPSSLVNSRPPSSAHSHQSPAGAPLTPATTSSAVSKTETSPGFLDSLQKYPYLRNSYLRSRGAYESPYSAAGGFSAAYQPLRLDEVQKSRSARTPSNSVSDGSGHAHQSWTPPSQVWHGAGIEKQEQQRQYQLPPMTVPQQSIFNRQLPMPTYQSPHDFQHSVQSLPSIASRDGAQARMMRDHGHLPYAAQPITHQPPRNSFGHAYDTARMWTTPPNQGHAQKAPTPSPISGPTSPPVHSHPPAHYPRMSTAPFSSGGGDAPWAPAPGAHAQYPNAAQYAMQRQPILNGMQNPDAGYATLPQMQRTGSETAWRHN